MLLPADLHFQYASAELVVLGGALITLVLDLAFKDNEARYVYFLCLLTCLGSAIASINIYTQSPLAVFAFNHMFVSDALANLGKTACALFLLCTLIYSRRYLLERKLLDEGRGSAIYALMLFMLLGTQVMASAANLLTLYLGIELMSLPLYALVAIARDERAPLEAAMKYFILGALASGFLLYGMSLLYGATATLDLASLGRFVPSSAARSLFVLGTLFILAGLAFKLGAAPFHMWVPDVFQGAPTPITLLLGSAPKLACFIILWRMLIQGLPALSSEWQQMIAGLAVASMLIGNISALVQTNFKRMLAYSSVAQMGFMLLGFVPDVIQAKPSYSFAAALFYTLTYTLTVMGSLAIVLLLSQGKCEADELKDLKALNQRSPLLAFALLILMLSLAGLPPLAGFYAKLAILQSLIETGHIALAIIAVILSLIAACYYLRVIKLMYFDQQDQDAQVCPPRHEHWLYLANAISIFLIGLWPSPLMEMCIKAVAVS